MHGARPPGLPKPKTSPLGKAKEASIVNTCISRVTKGLSAKDPSVKNFQACHDDYWKRAGLNKPELTDFLKNLNQCTRPGGIKSQSALFIKYQQCAMAVAG